MIRKSMMLALAAWPGALMAQAAPVESIDQTEILPELNASNVVPVLKVVTGNHVTSLDSDLNHFITATATNGLRFDVRFHGCEDPKAENIDKMQCRALSLVALWEPRGDAAVMNPVIADFLYKNPLANAGMLPDGSIYMTRYIIADYGIAQGNLLSEMANFVRTATDFTNTVNRTGAAATEK
ncbi:MAG: hypothetical protein AAFX04_09660 [Pseudomonadota bacterium]